MCFCILCVSVSGHDLERPEHQGSCDHYSLHCGVLGQQAKQTVNFGETLTSPGFHFATCKMEKRGVCSWIVSPLGLLKELLAESF